MIPDRPLDRQRSLLPDVPDYQFDGRCRRCGRPLTGKQSRKRGLGPACSKKRDQPLKRINT